jgi:hypothetical protein
MESTQFDMDFLAKETFALTEALRVESSEYQVEINQDRDFLHKSTIIANKALEEQYLDLDLEVELEEDVVDNAITDLPPVPDIEFTEYSFFPDIITTIPELPRFIESQQEHFEEEDLHADEGLLVSSTTYPEGPGIVFRLDAGVATFCVKGISTPNIAESFELLEEGNEEISKELKISDLSDIDNLYYFETKTIELANSIRENHINRRFPIEEELVCNISDPGFSWWFSEEDFGFQIFFKSHGLNRAEKYLRLGPIGDSQVAVMRFKQAETLIRSFFPVNDFVCTSKTFAVSTVKPNNLSYRILKDMFVNGINETSINQFPASSLGRTLYNYFQEVATLRGFWIYLEDLIKSNK